MVLSWDSWGSHGPWPIHWVDYHISQMAMSVVVSGFPETTSIGNPSGLSAFLWASFFGPEIGRFTLPYVPVMVEMRNIKIWGTQFSDKPSSKIKNPVLSCWHAFRLSSNTSSNQLTWNGHMELVLNGKPMETTIFLQEKTDCRELIFIDFSKFYLFVCQSPGPMGLGPLLNQFVVSHGCV